MTWHPHVAYRPADSLKTPLSLSLLLHGALAGLAMFSVIHSHSGDSWGGPGGSVTVGLVGNVPAIPLPHPDVSTTSRVVDNSKGLYKAEPPKIAPPPPDALPIPKFKDAQAAARKLIHRGRRRFLENPTPPPPNAVPYGGGGAPTIPTSSFAMGKGTTQGGLELQRRERRRFWVAIFLVCRGGAAADQQQLAAVDGRPERFGGAARGRDVHHSAGRHGDEHSADAAEQQLFGGYFGGARGEGFESAAASAGGLFRIERERGILVRFSAIDAFEGCIFEAIHR